MNDAKITCLNIHCSERKSLCCEGRSAYQGVTQTYVCSKCGKPYQGGVCSAIDTQDVKDFFGL